MTCTVQELSCNDGIEESVLYKVKTVSIKAGAHIYKGKRICELQIEAENKCLFVKAKFAGVVSKVLIKTGDEVSLGDVLIEIKTCTHPTVLGNICCDCGDVLEPRSDKPEKEKCQGLVSMLHSIPDLKVSKEEATRLGNEDINHLLDKRKLVLLVDLDQTLIHTTNDNIPPKLKDVFHFQLIQNGPWYHTRLRPYTCDFLNNISKLYELHICTFGVRAYAHAIAKFLDPDRKLFGDRILSRNECLDPMSKKANLSSLFPCGDNLVCIIDDRSDVWNFAPNVVQVLPYHFFQHTGDINAPPGLQKKENDDSAMGFDFSKLEEFASPKREESKEEETIKELCPLNDKKISSNEEKEKMEITEEKKGTENSMEKLLDLREKDSNNEKESRPTDIEENPDENKQRKNEKKYAKEESINESKLNKKSDNDSKSKETIEKESNVNSSRRSKSESIDSDEEKYVDTEPDAHTLDVKDSDDYLLYLEDILKKLHAIFYEKYDPNASREESSLPDLKEIVPDIKKTVLSNTNLVFSGIVPQNTSLRDSKAYHIATSLGAKVGDKFIAKSRKERSVDTSNCTTHVIAANRHTEKVHQAKRLKNVKIVSPNWLWCCAERWERVDERLFALNEDTENSVVRNPPLHCLVSLNGIEEHEQQHFEEAPASPKGEEWIESLNPLAFLSNDETKSMEEEVDDLLSAGEEDNKDTKNEDSEPSSESYEDDSALESLKGSNEEDDDDDDEKQRAKKRRRLADDDDDLGEEEEEDELPSIRFRQGGSLPSDESDGDSADDEMSAYGDILAMQLMKD